MSATYKDVKIDILAKITTGVWEPGSLLPNEVDLAEEYGCARATVNRAMRELSDDGVIERRRKAGTRVRMSPLKQARFDIPLVRDEIESSGAEYRYALASRDVGKAPDWLRTRLNLDMESRVINLTCMHFANGVPFQFEDRWINLAALPQAEDTDFSVEDPSGWLIATIPFSDAEISFSAGAVDENLASHFECEKGAPTFISERSTWWEGKAITYVRLSYRPGHRMTTRY